MFVPCGPCDNKTLVLKDNIYKTFSNLSGKEIFIEILNIVQSTAKKLFYHYSKLKIFTHIIKCRERPSEKCHFIEKFLCQIFNFQKYSINSKYTD